ncbi:MAG: hypothetical protein C0485_19205 [Pirellula sp.]|nr:hypothetical protein [Pirellula sp.]
MLTPKLHLGSRPPGKMRVTVMHKILFRSVIAIFALARADLSVCVAAWPEVGLVDELLKFTASDRAPFRVFGTSVAISGQRVLVGSPGAGNGGGSPGAAYLFDATTGQELWKFTSSEAAPQHQFGSSVAISGNRAIVGAYGDTTAGAGAAYVFDVATGQELFKLNVDDAQIGNAVAISGNVAVVGSYSDAAYLFDVTTGQQLFKLTASDTVPNDYFGFSVGISGNTAVVGSLYNGAYLFDVTTGQELLKLTHPESWTSTFGHAVAISGNTALVGSPVIGSAAAYVFDATTGESFAKLSAAESPDLFGASVAIDGDKALVGGWSYEEEFTRSAFLYDASTGQRLATLVPSDDMALYFREVNFGEAVALSGDIAVIGFSQDKAFTGSAYVYAIVPEPASAALVAIGAAAFAIRRGRRTKAMLCLLVGLSIAISGQDTRADIFQWEYVNPIDPALGTQESTLLAPDGAGASAEPGSNLSNRNLTKAYLAGVNLSPYLEYDEFSGYIGGYARSDLTSANLSQADLSDAALNAATLTGANLSGAFVRGANFDQFDQYGYSYAFGYGTGLTLAQLTSTASYAAHDLRGVSLGLNNLTGANFSGFDLAEARFAGANLSNVNFSNANLTDAVISGTLTGMNLSSAVVRGAGLWGISKAQLYSTSSYQTGDLTGLYFYSDDPGWNFAGKNLSDATITSDMNNSNFAGANLTNAYMERVSFQNANLSNADLKGADLSYGKLTGANFAGANVRGAKLSREFTYPGSGISISQLASTASYQAHDLTGIRLRGNVLTNANLANHNLTDADFVGASLTGANLTGAEVRGAQFHLHSSGQAGGLTAAQLQSTASYLAHDLSGIGLGGNNLAGANLVGQNLTNADFESAPYGANLNGADLSLANLTQARFGNSTLTGATLVGATLANLDLHLTEFGNANLSKANLAGSHFGGYVIVINGGEEGGGGYYNFPGTNLTGANLSGANLANADFSGTLDFLGAPSPGANLTNVNLNGADARGARFFATTLTGASTTNFIQPHGHIAGLDLTAEKTLVVRNYERFLGDDVPIVVHQQLAMQTSGALRLVFDADDWGSTISFAPGIQVALGGTLDLAFAAGVDPADQLGRSFDLFDWTGVAPTGAFSVSSPYLWDLTKLYTTGEVTLTGVAELLLGDFNGDSVINADDLATWQTGFGTTIAASGAQGDADGDHDVDGADFLAWQRQVGSTLMVAATDAVPEPSTCVTYLLAMVVGKLVIWRRVAS